MKAQVAFSQTTTEVGKLIATTDGNWDYFAVEDHDRKKSPYCYSVAKPTSGASTSSFGDLRHICNLIRDDMWDGEFTEYGRELMVKYGYEDYLNRYEEEKNYELRFYDTSRWYGKLLRNIIVKAKSRHEAYVRAYEMRTSEERDITVTLTKAAA